MELQSNDSLIVTTTDEASVEMSCEMGAYIRSDSYMYLVWKGPGDQYIIDGIDKHQITFTDGSPDAAAFGSFVLVPSRVSTLTISDPEPSDAGTYTCSVMDTDQAVAIELVVVNNISTTNSASTTSNTPSPATSINVPAIVSVGSVIGVIGLLTVTAIVLCLMRCVHNRSRIRSKGHSNDVDKTDKTIATSAIDCMEGNTTCSVAMDVIEAMEENKANGVVTSGIDTMERNEAYGVITDGTDTMKRNEAYGVVTDGIDTMERNEAYGVVTDGIDVVERNEAYGVITDCVDAMERNEAYGVATDSIDAI